MQTQKKRDDGWSFGFIMYDPGRNPTPLAKKKVKPRFLASPKTTPGAAPITNDPDGEDFDNEIDGLSSGWFPSTFTTFASAEELNALQSSLAMPGR